MRGLPSIHHLRNLWAHAVLSCELARGREQGYLPGDPLGELVEPATIRLHIDEQRAGADPMAGITTCFDLSSSEEDALWLLACCEAEPDLSAFVEHLASAGTHQLSVQQLQRMVGISLTQLERLSRLALVDMDRDGRAPIHRRQVRATDRVLEHLRDPAGLEGALDSSYATLVRGHGTSPTPGDVLVLVIGAAGSDRDEAILAQTRRLLLRVDCARLPADRRADVLPALARDARLLDASLLLCGADHVLADLTFQHTVCEVTSGPIFATVESPPLTVRRPTIMHEVTPMDRAARLACWRAALPAAADVALEACADRYRLPAKVVADVGRSLAADPTSCSPTLDDVQQQLRRRLDQRLRGFAKRVEWKQTWTDLVLPPDQLDLLVELIARVRCRERVLEGWGFGDKIGRGKGTTALFSGPPGTGKTMIAGLLASELGLDLYQADLSKIVSKYIGETEQRLAELFDAAEHGQAIILFDEADSLFGKRTEVRSSNDRYANLETNYLLQRLEAFEGVAILTTNHETAIDAAFLRRLSVHIRVPMPDAEHRALLWRSMLPRAAQVAGDIDYRGLATSFVMSGGYIKNAVLRAAYLAAAEDSALEDSHFWRAANMEYESMGKLATAHVR